MHRQALQTPSAYATTVLEASMTNPTPTPIANSQQPTRSRANRANAQLSTGPRTPAGKQRSSLNALRHGLTATSPVLPSEDPAAYADHRRRFFDEYQPATPTESQLAQELADTSWRLNRIPLLEAEVLARAAAPVPLDQEITFDIVDAHRLLANLGIQGNRLSRQFQKSLDKLREIQADRADRERRQLKDAAALLELHKHREIPWDPADLFAEDGFVFSKDRIERFSNRLQLLNQARHIEYALFHMQPPSPPDRETVVGHPTAPLASRDVPCPPVPVPNPQSRRASERPNFLVAAPAPLAP
jgi:hypothetical protein